MKLNNETPFDKADIKIKVVIPVNTSDFNSAIFEATHSAISSGTHIEIENITSGNPCIENKYHSTLNAVPTVDLIVHAEAEGFDAVFVCDMDMCGVDAARKLVKIPVHGGFSTSIPQAMCFGRFSIISVVEDVVDMQMEFAARFGGRENLASIRTTGLHVEALLNQDAVFETVYQQALIAIKEDRARALVLGCSGFTEMASAITERLVEEEGLYVPVIDPNRVAIAALELQVKTGLCHAHYCQ